MPDSAVQALRRAATDRARNTRRKVEKVLRTLDASGEPVTISSVAHKAGVSRTYLYGQPDLLEAIEKLREINSGLPHGVPRRQRATEASLLQRIEAPTARKKQLRAENADLRRDLPVSHGLLRHARLTTPGMEPR